MRKFTQLIGLVVLMTAFPIRGYAEEPVTPPFLEPQEEWVMTFDNYKNPGGNRALSRDVVIVRDNDDLYIRGLFAEYPDAWVRGTVNGKMLQITPRQFLGSDEENIDEYFYCGIYYHHWSYGHTYDYEETSFTPNGEYGSLLISDDGNTMTSDKKDASFWYTTKFGGEVSFLEGVELRYDAENPQGHWVQIGTGFPDVDYMLHMCMHKKGTSGIEGIGSESMDDAAAPMYDMQGRMVNPDTARPGIYIRNGKKVMIR